MKVKSVVSVLVLVLLLEAASVYAADDWSWGVESPRQGKDLIDEAPTPGVATFSVSVSPEQETPDGEADDYFIRKTLGDAPLPLEPHTAYVVGTAGVEGGVEGGVDGVVVAEEGSREGRLLGIGEKLCSYGIGINCNKKSGAVKGNYGAPLYSYPLPKPDYGSPIYKPVVPQNGYGAPPPPPVYPNRKYSSSGTGKDPTHSSSFSGLLSVLEPFMPGSKKKIPPKLGHDALNPSYTAPNPNYAPFLTSYHPPPSPVYATPRPSYSTPQYVAPKPEYIAPKPVHVAHKADYAPPKPNYAAALPSYVEPKPEYAEPKPVYAKAIQPTVIEHHTHSHTHVYQDQGAHHDVYQGLGSQQVFQRQDIKKEANFGIKNNHNLAKNQGITHQREQHNFQQGITQGITQQKEQHDFQQGITQQRDQHRFQHGFTQQKQQHHFQLESVSASDSSASVVPAVVVKQEFLPGRIETGFKPMASVQQTLFRPLAPTYREDCQCVPIPFCADEDVIGRSAPGDIRELLDARSKPTDILSNATDIVEKPATNVINATFVRRGRVLDLSAQSVSEEIAEDATESVIETDVTEAFTEGVLEDAATEAATEEETTEEVTEAVTVMTEGTRVRRETNSTDDETAAAHLSTDEETQAPDLASAPSDRQGRQLTGFTPGSNGCGPNHVCCRRPVYKPRRQRYTCGLRNAAGLLGRVKTAHFVEGDADFGEYPWQAAILRRKDGQIMYQCGATLIDDRHVLTAAHCMEGLHPSQLKVRLGEWDVSGQSEFYTHVELRAAGVYSHPEYYKGNLNNNLAVVRLEAPIDFSAYPHITPVCLPDEFSDFTHQRCHATGWGKDAFGSEGKFSQVLKEVELPILEDRQCEATLQQTRLGRDFALYEGNLCAGGEAGRDTCQGDGGSPLVCRGPDKRVQLAGLVSWGLGCGRPGVPGVYVEVAHYLDWIRDITKT
nr:uncharacterized protein LOC128688562 [Cherax quadricarinatus]